MNENLIQENAKLRERVAQQEKAIQILIKQCDEWVKSYDKLLKDFIHYRENN